ncbi:MAG TPA: sigma-70 family RNA polymerase sigma factor [Mycobacteriales bacterium]|jgi:RNA polymerase sigma factor (sigma-70 family)|nr:sigma-70 family RNA polymerase sigma factor [Mycobacteriales bacterium]
MSHDEGWPQIVAHRERLLRIARRRCPTREDAEDVVSEAMLRCATFGALDEARLGQFLTTVTVRLCADLYRNADRGTRALARLGADPDSVPGPEDEACRAADAALLAELLATLPDRQRAVLVDKASGLSLAQIALRNSLTYKAAESALARARTTLRTALATASGAIGAAWVSLRPRRVVALATVPVVAVLATSAVLRLPQGGDPALAGPPPAASVVAVPHGHHPAAAPAPRAPRPHPVAAARPVVTSVPSSAPVTVATPPRPPGKHYVTVGEGPNKYGVGYGTEPPPQTPQEAVEACTKGGVYVDARIVVGESPEADAGCGRRRPR